MPKTQNRNLRTAESKTGKRGKLIFARVNDADYQKIRELAAKSGVSLAGWIYLVAIEAAQAGTVFEVRSMMTVSKSAAKRAANG